MARPLRIEYPGAWYHVTCRGNERASIYRDDDDRRRFLQVLEESAETFAVEVHCYVLMSNHFHFLLKTPEANLSRFMQRFNTAYIAYYNIRHHRSGHLYQGRFKAIVVEADAYLLELSRYIHLNPVRVRGMGGTSSGEKMEMLTTYSWSSFPGYIQTKGRDAFMHYEEVLGYVGGDTKRGRERYRNFVKQGLDRDIEDPLKAVKGNAIVGTEGFISWLTEKFLDGRVLRNKDYPHVKQLRKSIPVAEIARVVAAEYGVSPDEILKARSPWGGARQVLVEISYRLNVTKKSLQELGQELGGIGGDAVGHAHERFQEKMKHDKRVTQRIERILQRLSQ